MARHIHRYTDLVHQAVHRGIQYSTYQCKCGKPKVKTKRVKEGKKP